MRRCAARDVRARRAGGGRGVLRWSHGYDTTELEARHDQERVAADKQAEAAETQARARDVRQAWAATREVAADDAEGPATEARVNASFDEIERRNIAR